jgi:LuxR family transcriptional regulator, maltose regulon positive regulatory protein
MPCAASPDPPVTPETRGSGPNPEPAYGEHLLIAAKLLAPRSRAGAIERPRLARKLLGAAEHRLTVVRADAGYGKTTALTQLAALLPECRWYGLSETDRDPLVLLVHLVALLGAGTAPGDLGRSRSVALLQQEGGAAKHWARAVDVLANDLHETMPEDRLLVLDDFHLAETPATQRIVQRLIEHAPPTLHVVLGTRRAPGIARMARWTASGDVLEVGKDDLAFAEDEVIELFWRRSGSELAPEGARRLVAQTDGWPIALQLLAQSSATELSDRRPSEREALFDYLADEVFEHQPPALKRFLLGACVLRRLDAELCDELLDRDDSAAQLEQLERASLFVTALGGGTWRLHPLFQEFLARRALANDERAWVAMHRQACTLLRRRGQTDEAIHHAVLAGSHKTAAEMLEGVAAELVMAGRYDTLAEWLDALPAAVVGGRPELLRARGDAARLTSRFDEAVESYAQARALFAARGDRLGESRALEGEALVYLDTVRPSMAGPLLRRALKVIDRGDRSARAHLLHLLAENSANHGDLERAERIERAARELVGGTTAGGDARLHLRRGRLAEARALAERQLRQEETEKRHGVPRSHRESTAVLAWIAAFSGDAEEARDYAGRALARGREMHAPIIEALALCRLGHGWMTGSDPRPEQALELYRDSLALSERISVDRFRAEALLGQVVAYGRLRRIEAARAAAREALAILEAAGDRYLSGVVWLALGAAGIASGHADAVSWLERGAQLAARSGDGYGVCLAAVWRAVVALRAEDWEAFDAAMGRALADADAQGLTALLTRHPFLGIQDPADLARLLRAAVRREVQATVAGRLLAELAPGDARVTAEDAPFRAKLLGPFELWAGARQVTSDAWSRDKALALFQLLVLHRGRALHREQVQEALWPQARRPDAAALSLRVALSALHRAVEPDRGRDEPPRLVRREGHALRLEPELLAVDVDAFEHALREARLHDTANGDPERALTALRAACALYRGDLLEERPYDEWAEEVRRALRDAYLRAGTRAAELMVRRGALEEAVDLCDALLARDPCWEPAYAHQIRALAGLGNRALALRSYERCVRALRDTLDLDPSPATVALRDSLLAGVP